MNENLPTNVQMDANGNGSVTFATDVIATIAGLAATEVEGVASMVGATGLADIITRKMQPTRNLTRGVRIELNGDTVAIHLTIVVDYGSPVPQVASNIQENVKKAVETMSGLTVSNVDVHVQGVSFERENKEALELEMQQRLMLQKQQEQSAEEASEPSTAEEPTAGQETAAEIEEPVKAQEEDEADYKLDLDEDLDEEEPQAEQETMETPAPEQEA